MLDYDTDFGIPEYVGQQDLPELHYVVLLERNMVGILPAQRLAYWPALVGCWLAVTWWVLGMG